MRKREYSNRSFFNSLSDLVLYGDFDDPAVVHEADAIWRDVNTLLATVKARLSTNIEGSDVERFNRAACGERVEVSSLTALLVQRAKEICVMTEGTFDPSVFPLVDLWGFSPRAFNHEPPVPMPYDRPESAGWLPPDERYVEAFHQLVGMEGIEIEGNEQSDFSLVKTTPAVEVDGVTYQAAIDLGGIAKGLIADIVAQYMLAHGFDHGCYSSASSIAALKSGSTTAPKDDPEAFRLNITSPRVGPATHAANFMQVNVHDRFLSTSGDYGRCHTFGDVVVSHEIDGRTGYPVNVTPAMVGHGGGASTSTNPDGSGAVLPAGISSDTLSTQSGICSLTLLGPSGVDCDALTTSLYLMGAQGAVQFFNENLKDKHDLVIVLYGDEQDHYRVVTSLAPGHYRILDRAYEVVSSITADGCITLPS